MVKSNIYNKTQNKWKGALDRVRMDIWMGDGWVGELGGREGEGGYIDP